MRIKKQSLSDFIEKTRVIISRNRSEFVITCVGQFLYLLQNVVQNKIFTSYFETKVFGQWSLLVSAYTFISMIPFSAIDQGIGRVAYDCKIKSNEKQLYSLIAFFYLTGFVIYTIIFFLMNAIQKEDFFASGYCTIFALYVFSEILKNTYIVIDNAYRKRKSVLIIRGFGLLSRTVLYLLFFSIRIFTIKNVLIILFITNVIILAYQSKYLRCIVFKIDKDICKDIAKRILVFSAPLMSWALFGWMQNMISRWYLDSILDLESVALYSILTTISYFVPNAIYTVINAYVMPIVFQKNSAFTRKSLLKYVFSVGSVMMLYFVFITLFGEDLVLFLADKKYLSICKYLPITTLSSILYVMAMLSTVEIYQKGNTKKLLIPTILPGFFMATVGYFLIKKYGFNGAVLNYILGQVIYTVLTLTVVFNKKNI